jgi:hypothetical protein
MNIKQKYGVDDFHFYQLTKVSEIEEGTVHTCSTTNFDREMGVEREYKTGTWRQDPLEGDLLKTILKDLQRNKGNIYFLDTKKYYKSLDNLLKDHYTLCSIRTAVYNTQKPEEKDD